MGITGTLIAIAIIVVVLAVAGTQVSAFINDTLRGFGETVRDQENKIPNAPQGVIVCDMIVTADWEVQNTVIFALEPQPIIFFKDSDIDGSGVGFQIDYRDCKVSNGLGLSFLPLLDFLGASSEVQPLDFIIPDFPLFDLPYELSWILVDDQGKQKKVQHYQDVEYVVPSGQFDFRYQQVLIFREIIPDDYVLRIEPQVARFFEHDDGEAFLFGIPDPT